MPVIMDEGRSAEYFKRRNDGAVEFRVELWEERHPLKIGDLVKIWLCGTIGSTVGWTQGLVVEVHRHPGFYRVSLLGEGPAWYYRRHIQRIED